MARVHAIHTGFDRLIPKFRRIAEDDELAQEIGRAFGPMHSSGQGENKTMPAGFTYLGQLIDHDLTFDPSPGLQAPRNPNAVRNFRTAAFDLDSIYGFGPNVSSHLYDPNDPRKLFLGPGRADLPRLQNDIAVIGDPRNDENIIVSQLLTAFINFHNEAVDQTGGTFEEAQQLVRWHYQWIVLHQYLPKVVGDSTQNILRNSSGRWRQASIPLEFSLAAFRFGHSQIRARYDINSDVQGKARLILPDLAGHRRLRPIDRVEWPFFFDLKNGNRPQPSLPIHPFLSPPCLSMPPGSVGPTNSPVELSLAYRDIRRGQLRELPAAHEAAAKLHIPQRLIVPMESVWARIKARQVRSGSRHDPSGKDVPLWLYILFEAQDFGNSEHLGPLGGRIVSDVCVGLLESAPESFLSQNPNWTPTFGSTPGDFDIADLIRMAEAQKNRP